MRVIVPGGYYSYDSAGKKIWLDYQYYGTTLENIERVKNLTRNKILYDCKRSTVLPTVENGCITHSYQGTEADTDKIQVTLKTPITNSLTELEAVDGVVTLETDGKVLVLPTEDAAILPSFNQSVLNSDRLTIAESPFGGLKTGSPDYCPGTLYTATDGVNLTDVNGQNSTKTLTAGMLKGVNGLTVDPVAHTITEEFIVANTAESNNHTVIDNCDSTSGWVTSSGTHSEFISENGKLKITGTPFSGWLVVDKAVTLDLSAYSFLIFKMSATVNCKLYLDIQTTSSYTSTWSKYAVYPVTTTEQIFIVPLDAPLNSYRGPNYAKSANYTKSSITKIRIGVSDAGSAPMTYYIDNITADSGKTATIEAQVPDNLSATSLTLYTHDGTAYQLCSSHSLDGAYSQLSQTSANCTFLDSTKLDDVFGVAGGGRAVFPKSSAGTTVNGSTGSITYSENRGTDKRIGLTVNLPPSDGGRTNFNKVRAKLVINYTDTVGNIVPDLSGNNNTGTIVGGVTKLNDGGLRFDGSTGYVNCGSIANYLTQFSMCIKLKTTNLTTTQDVAGRGSFTTKQWLFRKNANNTFSLFISADGTNTSDNLTTVQAINDTGYHNVIVTFNAGLITITVDGVSVSKQSAVTSFSSQTAILTLAKSQWGGFFLQGDIFEYLHYNRELSQSEITAYTSNQSMSQTGLVIRYTPAVLNMGSTTHQFADSTNTSYGLQNLSKPWIALYDPANSLIDFYLFTHRPQNLSFKRDETGTIYSLSLYPGAGSVYHGQIPFADLTRDTNSDSVPDCLEAAVDGSVTKFLANYSMVI